MDSKTCERIGGVNQLVSEEMRLQRLDHTKDELRKLMQRWDNRISLEKMSLCEEYVRNRLSIAVYLKWILGPNGPQDSSSFYGKITSTDNNGILIFSVYPGETHHREYRNNELVLVEIIKLAECPQRIVPSLVRLYHINDDLNEIGSGFLYFGYLSGYYKSAPFFVHRERDPIVVRSNDFGGHIVECRPEIVDRVANYERDFHWKIGDRIELQDAVAGINIRLDMKLVEVSLKEGYQGILQISDVAVGPLDL